jgi:hypothetical protein
MLRANLSCCDFFVNDACSVCQTIRIDVNDARENEEQLAVNEMEQFILIGY